MQSTSYVSVLPLLASALVGIVLGLGGFTFYYAEGASYLSNDPVACANCHIMRAQLDGWQKGSHHQVATCNDCHTPHELVPKYISKMENGFRHSTAFTLNNFPEPIQITARNSAILQQNCIDCHEDLVSQINTHSGSEKDNLECVRCHAGVGHGSDGN
ncbi:MAG: cytochrome c nitrite reductase small subunit [Anaerolineae bacterium]